LRTFWSTVEEGSGVKSLLRYTLASNLDKAALDAIYETRRDPGQVPDLGDSYNLYFTFLQYSAEPQRQQSTERDKRVHIIWYIEHCGI
jgi:hypothetical protein